MTSAHSSSRRPRTRIGRLWVDGVTRAEALDVIDSMVGRGGSVFTPNVDHVVQAEDDERFRRAYASADLSLADGFPVVLASRFVGPPLPERVTGSDLVVPLMELAARRGRRVYFLGGAPNAGELAAGKLRAMFPELQITGVEAPRIDINAPLEAHRPILDRIAAARADFVLVALGAPKQEIWIHEVGRELAGPVYLGIGASLDFIAGLTPRAPRILSKVGLEWAYRLATEPRRLWRRYLVRDMRYPGILARQVVTSLRASSNDARGT